MIAAVSIRSYGVLMAVKETADTEARYISFPIDRELFEQSSQPGAIWNSADDEVRAIATKLERVIYCAPASYCMAKRIEYELNPEIDDESLIKWHAKTQIPGDPENYEYGFIPVSRSFDGKRAEVIFYAAPESRIFKIRRALVSEKSAFEITLLPEQIALVEVIKKSIGKDDISQAALLHLENNYIVAVFIRDNRYYRSRVFRRDISINDNLSIDIKTYLLSLGALDEPLPLVITGEIDGFKIDWPSIVPCFMNIHESDFIIPWGSLQFIAAGGRCESPAAI